MVEGGNRERGIGNRREIAISVLYLFMTTYLEISCDQLKAGASWSAKQVLRAPRSGSLRDRDIMFHSLNFDTFGIIGF